MCSTLRGSYWLVEALTYLGQRQGGETWNGHRMAHAQRAWYGTHRIYLYLVQKYPLGFFNPQMAHLCHMLKKKCKCYSKTSISILLLHCSMFCFYNPPSSHCFILLFRHLSGKFPSHSYFSSADSSINRATAKIMEKNNAFTLVRSELTVLHVHHVSFIWFFHLAVTRFIPPATLPDSAFKKAKGNFNFTIQIHCLMILRPFPQKLWW